MQKEECVDIFERYLQHRATTDEVKRLSDWIRNNKEISLWLEQQIISSSSTIDSDVQMRMLQNITHEIKSLDRGYNTNKSIRGYFNKWLRVAAIFFMPLLAAGGVYIYMSKNDASTSPLIVSVERGQKANITLPDGSKVWLNSQSKLIYSADFNVSQRELLLDGEAYFEVAHNPSKPFVVKSKDMSVEALGTAFSVKAYDEDNSVTSILMHGKVRVTTPAGENILLPNERIQYDKANKKVIKTKVVNASDFAGWMNQELRFDDESLLEIANSIQRMYNVNIVFADEKSKSYHFTGTVPNDNLESVLNMITITTPVVFRANKKQITILEKNNTNR